MPTSAKISPRKPLFIAGEAQIEALARIEYQQQRGGGWCEVSGPRGIGKTSLLHELAERARQRGDRHAWFDLGPLTSFDWFGLLADAWHIDLPLGISSLEARRRFEDHVAGWRAMNRTAWLLVDHAEGFTEDLSRGCRWLCQLAQRQEVPLMLIAVRRTDGESRARQDDADLHLELWPWEPVDCERYVEAACQSLVRGVTFTSGAIGALGERSGGVPLDVAKLVDWCLAAAEAESLVDIEPELIHAIADEFSPRESYHPPYETSAAYGAW